MGKHGLRAADEQELLPGSGRSARRQLSTGKVAVETA